MNIDKTKPIMLTGATGYVGGHIAKKLMEEGLTVHAPVRNPNKKEKLKYLEEIANSSAGSIKFFEADLLKDGSYEKAMNGCELVIHTASPFISSTKNPQEDLVDPALKGTTNVLDTVQKTESVKRVVLTSSCVAMYGDAKDTLDYPNQTMTEEIWNTTSSVNKSPYNYSKTVAEQKAWKMNEGQDRWDLVVINPSFVIGPGISPTGSSESYNIFKQMGDGTMKMGCADLNMGMVDVRDVALAHYKAAFTPEAKGRHITSAHNGSFLELATWLRDEFGNDYPFPKKNLPKWLIWLTGPMAGIPRAFVKDNVGYPWKADNSKSKKDLGMNYRPIEKAATEFFQQMIDNGTFSKN